MAHIDLNMAKVIDIADPIESRSKSGNNAISVAPGAIGLSLMAYKNLELSDRHRYCEIKKIVYPIDGKNHVCVMLHFSQQKERYSWYVNTGKQYKAYICSKACVSRFFGNVTKTKRFEDVILDPDQKVAIIRICRTDDEKEE